MRCMRSIHKSQAKNYAFSPLIEDGKRNKPNLPTNHQTKLPFNTAKEQKRMISYKPSDLPIQCDMGTFPSVYAIHTFVIQHRIDIYSCDCGVWPLHMYSRINNLSSQNKLLLLCLHTTQFPGVYVPFVYSFVSHNHMRWPWTKHYHCRKEHEGYVNCAVGMTFPSQNKCLPVLLLIVYPLDIVRTQNTEGRLRNVWLKLQPHQPNMFKWSLQQIVLSPSTKRNL